MLRKAVRVLDVFIPMDVLTSVLMVFALENALNFYITEALGGAGGPIWIGIYLIGLLVVLVINYASLDEDDIEDLEEALESE